MRQPCWKNISERVLRQELVDSPDLLPWLIIKRSITRRVEKMAQSPVEVQVLHHGFLIPRCFEASLLAQSSEDEALVREVILSCKKTPYMFARTIFSKQLVEASGNVLINLGDQPLGKLLFDEVDLRRGRLEYSKFCLGMYEYDRIYDVLKGRLEQHTYFWARRSVFYWQGGALLLIEVFLPGILFFDRNFKI